MSSSTGVALNLGAPPSEKLARGNFTIWKAQVLPALQGAQVTGLLDNTDAAPSKMVEITKADKTSAMESNPLDRPWIAKDQQVLAYLLNSMTPEILGQVIGKDSTFELWTTVTTLFASQSQSRITNLRIAITTTKKGSMSRSTFMAKMKNLADELAVVGRPVSDPEMVDYILAGLDRDYDPVVAAVGAVKNLIMADDLFAQISAFDQRMEMLGDSSSGSFHTSANAAYRGCGQNHGRSNAGEEEGGAAVVTASPLLLVEATTTEDALVSNSSSSKGVISNSMTTLDVRYATSIIQGCTHMLVAL